MDSFDLDAYFARIGYAGPVEPTLPVLHALVGRQSAAIAFENLDPIAGRTPALDLASLHPPIGPVRRNRKFFQNVFPSPAGNHFPRREGTPQDRVDDLLQMAPGIFGLTVMVADDLALFGNFDAAPDGAGRLGENGLAGGSASPADTASPAVKKSKVTICLSATRTSSTWAR